MIPNLNLPELIVIGMLAIIFFGKDKLPSAAKSLGESIRMFKNSLNMEPLLEDVASDKKAEKVAVTEIETPKKAKAHKAKIAVK